ncbi:MAG: TIGR00341 family protein, partial [Bacteroidota bacterium]
PVLEHAPGTNEDSAVEEATRKHFGLRLRDRPTLYRETAEAATDTDVPFFVVLLLSGAIATLGLVLNSTAVVIGAMLVAPLLGPLLGLSLALTVGDGRLFVQTAASVVVGALGIVLLAAGLTLLLPFETVTDEIASRTRPTTLDLGIAVFSGLAGAVVTASREARLSASIPGVAVAVALVPPLGVAGFGLAVGRAEFVRGALLLFGANLAGIVLSGMVIFFLIGMHRTDVVKTAREWHDEGHATGLAARLSSARWLDRLPGLASPVGRFVLVVAFMAGVAVPLTTSLQQVVRETRVGSVVSSVASDLEAEEQAFVLDREVTYSEGESAVRLRVATRDRMSTVEEDSLEAVLADGAGEPVALTLVQVLASERDLESLATALPQPPAARTSADAISSRAAAVGDLRARLADALDGLALPDSVQVVGGAVRIDASGSSPTLTVSYGAERRLPPEAEAILGRSAAQALGLDASAGRAALVSLAPRPLPDSAGARTLAALLSRHPRLRLTLSGDSATVQEARQRLASAGAPAGRLRLQPGTAVSGARLSVAPDTTETESR